MARERILITDDEANIRLMLRTALESEGYEILEAPNGNEALKFVEAGAVDLVLLDLNMPVLDGMAFLERLQEMPAEQRPLVIVLTAYGSIPAAVKATRLGAVDFLEKPVTPDDLRQTVNGVLHESRVKEVHGDRAYEGGYDGVLSRVRKALRLADLTSAETLLMKAADLAHGRDAPYFNLLGVLYETQRNWRLARKFYGKAMRADRECAAAKQNMRRLYELDTFGRSKVPITLGDEPDFLIPQVPARPVG
jgi:CheY-like chemotaxis protein